MKALLILTLLFGSFTASAKGKLATPPARLQIICYAPESSQQPELKITGSFTALPKPTANGMNMMGDVTADVGGIYKFHDVMKVEAAYGTDVIEDVEFKGLVFRSLSGSDPAKPLTDHFYAAIFSVGLSPAEYAGQGYVNPSWFKNGLSFNCETK